MSIYTPHTEAYHISLALGFSRKICSPSTVRGPKAIHSETSAAVTPHMSTTRAILCQSLKRLSHAQRASRLKNRVNIIFAPHQPVIGPHSIVKGTCVIQAKIKSLWAYFFTERVYLYPSATKKNITGGVSRLSSTNNLCQNGRYSNRPSGGVSPTLSHAKRCPQSIKK